jgi:hypothetical protein
MSGVFQKSIAMVYFAITFALSQLLALLERRMDETREFSLDDIAARPRLNGHNRR